MTKQTDLHQAFISKLEIHYGTFNSEKNSFESTSNSKIARDLFYSDSQFSRLINNTASEGELIRAVNNVDRLLKVHALEHQIDSLQQPITKPNSSFRKFILPTIFAIALIGLIIFYFGTFNKKSTAEVTGDHNRYEMLKWSFENNYIKPYITLKELPEDCYFPCYKYQGKWELKNEYKIPFFRERNGFHYIAKEAIMYASCSDKMISNGEAFEGYEYQKHEIWYDKREFPIDSFLVKGSMTKVRPSYNEAKLEEDPNFVKIAYIHTFFKTEFQIDSSIVKRTGKAIGRDLEFIPDQEISDKLKSKVLLKELKNEINTIAKNRLEDFSKPVTCNPTRAPKVDFNLVEQGDSLSFDCQFSTGRFLVDYTKTYVLKSQYINNYCR